MKETTVLALLALVLGCAHRSVGGESALPGSPETDLAAQINAVADGYMEVYFDRHPESATINGIEGAAHDRLTDRSQEAREKWWVQQDRFLAALSRIDVSALRGTPEWVTYGVLREALEAARGQRVCRLADWRVDQGEGWQARLQELARAQPMNTASERRQAMTRWRDVPGLIDDEITNLRRGLADGFSAPKRNAELVIGQLDAILRMPPERSPYYFVPASSAPATKTRWLGLLTKTVNPAIKRYRDFLKNDYLPAARESMAITSIPGGGECYAALLRQNTTLPLSAAEVFALGEKLISSREARMVELGPKVFGTSTLVDIRMRIRDDPKARFRSRDEIMAFTAAAIERAERRAGAYFSRLPRASVVVRPVSKHQERSRTAYYEAASTDGARPATYFINLFEPASQDRGDVEITAFHETFPGHHLQISIARELGDAHAVTRYLTNSGFSEGWARYAESLADEMGLYSSDRYTLAMLASLPTGMVVDPGIHIMGWSRDQAIRYTLDKQPAMTQSTAEAYVDRIAIWPGQMTTYGVGEMEILRLRRQSQAKLGAEFDIKEFHHRVLGAGNVTLGMLRMIFEPETSSEKKAIQR